MNARPLPPAAQVLCVRLVGAMIPVAEKATGMTYDEKCEAARLALAEITQVFLGDLVLELFAEAHAEGLEELERGDITVRLAERNVHLNNWTVGRLLARMQNTRRTSDGRRLLWARTEPNTAGHEHITYRLPPPKIVGADNGVDDTGDVHR